MSQSLRESDFLQSRTRKGTYADLGDRFGNGYPFYLTPFQCKTPDGIQLFRQNQFFGILALRIPYQFPSTLVVKQSVQRLVIPVCRSNVDFLQVWTLIRGSYLLQFKRKNQPFQCRCRTERAVFHIDSPLRKSLFTQVRQVAEHAVADGIIGSETAARIIHPSADNPRISQIKYLDFPRSMLSGHCRAAHLAQETYVVTVQRGRNAQGGIGIFLFLVNQLGQTSRLEVTDGVAGAELQGLTAGASQTVGGKSLDVIGRQRFQVGQVKGKRTACLVPFRFRFPVFSLSFFSPQVTVFGDGLTTVIGQRTRQDDAHRSLSDDAYRTDGRQGIGIRLKLQHLTLCGLMSVPGFQTEIIRRSRLQILQLYLRCLPRLARYPFTHVRSISIAEFAFAHRAASLCFHFSCQHGSRAGNLLCRLHAYPGSQRFGYRFFHTTGDSCSQQEESYDES